MNDSQTSPTSVCSPAVCLSACRSVCLSGCPSLSLSLSLCLSARPSVCLSVYPSVCLPVCLSIHPSVCLKVTNLCLFLMLVDSGSRSWRFLIWLQECVVTFKAGGRDCGRWPSAFYPSCFPCLSCLNMNCKDV